MDDPFVDEVDAVLDVAVREAKRAEQIEARKKLENQLEYDYTWLMSTLAGRRVIWELVAPLWRSSYTGGREDTDFREGERNAALKLWARIQKYCPSMTRKMLEENPQ